MNNDKKKISVIIVGGGPAGIACAITLARAGKDVLVVERGNFAGAKNMFGGAVYTKPTAEIFPDFIGQKAPVERFITQHRYILLDDMEAVQINYSQSNKESFYDYEAFTTFRPKWDKWCAQEAQKAGVVIAENTVVRELIVKDKKVIGIKTDYEEYYCDVVVIAEGVNTLLCKQIGLKDIAKPKDVALGIKEVIKLPKETIEERFSLSDNTGCVVEFAGGVLKGTVALGYMYTNQNSVAIGIGIGLDELQKLKVKPYDLLEQIKQHPSISPLIKDGTLLEYSAHLIPEGGYNAIGKIYSDGVLVVGDAAGLVNNVHWEGTNLAMMSGKFAAETIIEAINKNDFSSRTLSLYKKKLEQSFIFKDLKSYKNIMDIIHVQKKSYLDFWIKKINEFFKTFTSVDSIPKKTKFLNYGLNIIKQRKITGLVKDAVNFIKIGIGIFK